MGRFTVWGSYWRVGFRKVHGVEKRGTRYLSVSSVIQLPKNVEFEVSEHAGLVLIQREG